ncbi:MAG: hypothetical protein Kow0022_17680 [Phycisphaerales bacterium]
MLVPLGTDQLSRRRPIITAFLLALTVGCFVVQNVLARTDPDLALRLLETFELHTGSSFRWWGLFTCTLLHGGWIHLAGNMFFLWTFGPPVEDRFGHAGFLGFYLAGAAASSGAHALLETVPAIGASGAIAAVAGAFLVLFPFTRVRCLWLFGMMIMHAPAWWLIGLGIIWNLFAHGFGMDHRVAHVAHLAGYGFGAATAMLLLWIRVFAPQPYDLFTVIRQAHRRRLLRAATAGTAVIPRPQRALARPDDHTTDAIAQARARIATLVAERKLAEAADAYARFRSDFAHRPELLTLGRNTQYELATFYFREGHYAEAAEAFARFLDLYADDREADAIRLLLARTYRTRLGRPAEAERLLNRLLEQAIDQELRDAARQELEALPRASAQD